MNNEIKEILKDLKDKDSYITQEQAEILYDYITNLQEEYRKADEDRHELFDRIEKAVGYIENDLKSFLYSIEYKTLLNILQGSDEE